METNTDKPTIDFNIMRSNCVEIHQQLTMLFKVAKQVGEKLNLIVNSADELRTHEQTKTWDGMGRFAKELHDNAGVWARLPESLTLRVDLAYEGHIDTWHKEKARKALLDCYLELGGKNLYVKS